MKTSISGIIICCIFFPSSSFSTRGSARWELSFVNAGISETMGKERDDQLSFYSFGSGKFYSGNFAIGVTLLQRNYGNIEEWENIKCIFDNCFDGFLPFSLSFIPGINSCFGGWLSSEFFIKGAAWGMNKNKSYADYDYYPLPSYYIDGGFSFNFNPLKFIPFSFNFGLLALKYPKVSEVPDDIKTTYIVPHGTLVFGLGYLKTIYPPAKVTPYLLIQENNMNGVLESGETAVIMLILKSTSPLNDLDLNISVSPDSSKRTMLIDSIYNIRSLVDWKEKKIEMPILALKDIPKSEVEIFIEGKDSKGNKLFKAKSKLRTGEINAWQ